MVYFPVMTSDYYMVFCTTPDGDTASRIAAALVDQNLAACVNMISGIRSVYRWEGKRHCDEECLMLIKTRRDRYPALEDLVRTLHPYEIPEIIAVPLEGGGAAYLGWVDGQVQEGNQ